MVVARAPEACLCDLPAGPGHDLVQSLKDRVVGWAPLGALRGDVGSWEERQCVGCWQRPLPHLSFQSRNGGAHERVSEASDS